MCSERNTPSACKYSTNSFGSLIIFDLMLTHQKLLYHDKNAQLRICYFVSEGKGSKVTVKGSDAWSPVGTGGIFV